MKFLRFLKAASNCFCWINYVKWRHIFTNIKSSATAYHFLKKANLCVFHIGYLPFHRTYFKWRLIWILVLAYGNLLYSIWFRALFLEYYLCYISRASFFDKNFIFEIMWYNRWTLSLFGCKTSYLFYSAVYEFMQNNLFLTSLRFG